MAVSKIAVMALVGILAVPILLGYALNLSEVTETDYEKDGESVNVTPILANDVAYSYAYADAYTLNSNFANYSAYRPSTPHYNSVTSVNTAVPVQTFAFNNWGDNGFSVSMMNIKMIYDTSVVNLSGRLTNENNVTVGNYSNIKELYFNTSDNQLYITTFDGTNYQVTQLTANTGYHMYYTRTPSNQNVYFEVNRVQSNTSTYADMSKGYYFESTGNHYINLPKDTNNLVMTINLDSITAPNYEIYMSVLASSIHLKKETVNGVVTWTSLGENKKLYYDPSRNDNTYQIKTTYSYGGVVNNYYRYTYTATYNYVGGWPTVIGDANPYWTYVKESAISTNNPTPDFDHIEIYNDDIYPIDRTPTMRIDSGYGRAFEYDIIKDRTYSPAELKSNPTTTIKNISYYGTSIEFGGNTYSVGSDGNIMLGTHKTSLNGITFDSVPVPVGYENRINGVVVSVTAQPSTIKFNGDWSASIETAAQTATTYTKTEWNAGSFAWDGIDHNFLIVGLITCLGAFIALGIYLRKTGKGLMPLLIVCGCAAGLFFCMI